MSLADLIPIALILLFTFVFLLGGGVVCLAIWFKRRTDAVISAPILSTPNHGASQPAPASGGFVKRPNAWLAVRRRSVAEVEAALALDNTRHAIWGDDPNGECILFIMPPVKGWVIVFGNQLPDPSDDVDACFRFLTGLSRKLGELQFFWSEPAVHHHAWASIDDGRVVRAYGWAGTTVWNQGPKTAAEVSLGIKCFNYAEEPQQTKWGLSELLAANVEKVPLLAARWSLDPAALDESIFAQAHGIIGKPSDRY